MRNKSTPGKTYKSHIGVQGILSPLSQIEAALRALPRNSRVIDQKYEQRIYWDARSLVRHRVQSGRTESSRKRDYLIYGQEGAPRGRSELKGLVLRLNALIKYTEEEILQPEALLALEEVGLINEEFGKEELVEKFGQMKKCVLKALDSVSVQKGKPRSSRARTVSLSAYRIYERVTGQVPTRSYSEPRHVTYGHFYNFLNALFAALDIEASPANWAREAIKIMAKSEQGPAKKTP